MSYHVVLTGASGGIGAKLIGELLGRFDDMHITGIYNQRRPVDPGLFRFSFVQCDLSDPEQVAYLPQNIDHLTPYAVINLAGQTYNAMSWKADPNDTANLFESNALAAMNVCRAFIPGMRELARGRIINVTSVVAHTGVAGASAYAATKGAIEAYTRSIALELAPKGITANSIALGYMEAGMVEHVPEKDMLAIVERTPLKRVGKVAELAELITYLLSPGSQFMTGQTLHLNGGIHLT